MQFGHARPEVLEMLPERRRRLITILWRLVVLPVAVLAAAVVGFSAYAVLTLAPLAPWHSLELKEEFEARRDGQLDFAGLLALEGRLFDELRHAKVLRSSDLAEEQSSRFSPGSWVARLTGAPGDAASGDVYTAPYNRTFELVPAERRGSALLIHGLTDAPYSMLALARRLHARGLHVVVLRLPGHGTVPAGQLRMTLEDWRAAVQIAAHHAASLASADQPFYVGGYSTGGTLALTHSIEKSQRSDASSANARLARFTSDRIAGYRRPDADHRRAGVPARTGNGALAGGPAGVRSLQIQFVRGQLDAPGAGRHQYFGARHRAGGGGWPSGQAAAGYCLAVGRRIRRSAPEACSIPCSDASWGRSMSWCCSTSTVWPSFDPWRLLEFAGLPELLPGLQRPHTLTVVANRSDASELVVMRRRAPGQAWTEIDTGLAWPRSIVSVGHVALCFPPDDSVYRIPPR